jgi:uncharacterized protein with NRDE domain
MCLAVLALGMHPRHALVIAANRDEAHARPTAPAAWWGEGWLGGRDLAAGGTWLGVTREGRWALLTNVRDPSRHDPAAPSRGRLVTDFLDSGAEPGAAMHAVVESGAPHNGFNLLGGRVDDAHWASNRAAGVRALPTGIHGLSNHLLDTPWPKVVRTKAALAAWCASTTHGDDDVEPLFAMLRETWIAPDAELPQTGVTLERERLLSAPFIVSPVYGTRCSTVVTIGYDGAARLVERTFDAGGARTGEAEHRFGVAPAR